MEKQIFNKVQIILDTDGDWYIDYKEIAEEYSNLDLNIDKSDYLITITLTTSLDENELNVAESLLARALNIFNDILLLKEHKYVADDKPMSITRFFNNNKIMYGEYENGNYSVKVKMWDESYYF